jgi:DNA-binding beta-propeller fold protein YncE
VRARRLAEAATCLTAALIALAPGAARADLPPAGQPVHTISNFGRLIAPFGALSQLEYFPLNAAMTPDGRFVWTLGTRSSASHTDIQISDAASGQIVQQLQEPQRPSSVDRGRLRGIAISHDGTHAYLSDARDQIDVYDIDPASGHATLDAKPTIPVPPPPGQQPPDDYPPNQPATPPPAPPPPDFPGPNHGAPTSYPEGLALSADDSKLVAALNLSDHVAVIDLKTRAVQQVQVRDDGRAGDHAYPANVAIAGRRAFVTDEGDGTVASFDLSDPSGIERVTPQFDDPSQLNPKRTHPNGIVAAPDGKHVFVSLTSADQVLELDAANPSKVTRRFDVRRVTGVGTQPVGLAVTPEGDTLFVADVGEDVVRAIALTKRDVRLPAGVDSLPQSLGGAGAGSKVKKCKKVKPKKRKRHKKKRKKRPHRAAKSRKKHRKKRRRKARCIHRDERLRGRSGSLRSGSVRAGGSRPGARGGATVTKAANRVVTVHSGDELARIPSGIWPRQVMLAPGARRLAILTSKGVGPGSTFAAGEGVAAHIPGVLQRIKLPPADDDRDTAIVAAGIGGVDTPVPVDHQPTAPAGSPLVGPNGGASSKIKYVFYVVTENKTFDIILGDLGRGNGDPCLAIYGERRSLRKHADGSPCPYERFGVNDDDDRNGLNPTQRMDGTPITPNEHKIARQWVTLDNAYANSETSDDGHIWTSAAYAPEYDVRATLSSPHPFDLLYPISAPPKGFFFDSLVRQGVGFFNYGEAAAGLAFPDSQADPEEQSVRSQVLKNSEFITQYPSSGAIDKDPITQRETLDHDPCQDAGLPPGVPCPQLNPATQVSRMQYFSKRFQGQLAACAAPSDPGTCQVPQFNELLMPNNHTSGTDSGTRTPDALVRDTDQAIGQLVDEISHSKIWPYSAIFLVQDDAQDGADHVEGHRITSLVVSPYAKRGAVVSTHYDQMSVIRTIELILGMKPTYLYDSLARPMWEAFQSKADNGAYDRVKIDAALMDERNVAHAPMSRESAKYTWVADAVPEHVMNRMDWAMRYGSVEACPRRVGGNDPCEDDTDEDEREIDKAEATHAALRKYALERRLRGRRP